jgi:hypothetical protein
VMLSPLRPAPSKARTGVMSYCKREEGMGGIPAMSVQQ